MSASMLLPKAHAASAASCHDTDIEYWTLKESYIKARGMGLGSSLPVDSFSFAFPHHSTVSITIDPELQDRADRLSFWQYRPTADYLMAICAESHVDDAPAISIRKFTPLGNEIPMIAPFQRRSEGY